MPNIKVQCNVYRTAVFNGVSIGRGEKGFYFLSQKQTSAQVGKIFCTIAIVPFTIQIQQEGTKYGVAFLVRISPILEDE